VHLEKRGVGYPLLPKCVGGIIVPIVSGFFVQQTNQVKRQGKAHRCLAVVLTQYN
jgi:hypothetical protein